MSVAIDWLALRNAALAARLHAHAPYSHFQVGAALLGTDGRLWSGCNVENASYGLTVCAERNALFAAVAAGCKSFRALAVITSSSDPVTPCGACRQVLVEFPPSFEVRCYGTNGSELHETTAGLLPHAFSKQSLG
ncbi:MAG TPA: cytidine deaminase [Polyangiales bacterium]